MLMQEPTEDMIKKWKEIYYKYKYQIKPNKKSGVDVIQYLEDHYTVSEIEDNEIESFVYDNIVNNEFSHNKLNGGNPIIRLFEIDNSGNGKQLYSNQDEVFKNMKIVVGVELKTSYLFVEGSSYLFDELTAYTGLDEEDLKNYFLVAQYVECKEKFHKL